MAIKKHRPILTFPWPTLVTKLKQRTNLALLKCTWVSTVHQYGEMEWRLGIPYVMALVRLIASLYIRVV